MQAVFKIGLKDLATELEILVTNIRIF